MNKVYVVKNYGGEYEDYWQHIVGIFDNVIQAIEVAELQWEENGNWMDKLPIPYNTFINHIDHFNYVECIDEEGYDHEKLDFYDYEGYTEEQWEKSNKIYEKNRYSDYSFTDIREFDLNQIIEYHPKQTIWIKHSKNEDE